MNVQLNIANIYSNLPTLRNTARYAAMTATGYVALRYWPACLFGMAVFHWSTQNKREIRILPAIVGFTLSSPLHAFIILANMNKKP